MISVSISHGAPDPEIAGAWADLVQRASPNVFMTPAALAAAIETGFARVHVLLAWEEANGSRRLVGLWALRECKAPLRPRVLDALPYEYAFLSTPVIDPDVAEDVMSAFLSAIAAERGLPHVIRLPSFDQETPVHEAMLTALAARGGNWIRLRDISRPRATRDDGIKRSGATRKKLRQDWKRLSTLGVADVVNAREPSAVRDAFETFLALEKASWKGTHGTALLCDVRDAAFSRRLIANLAAGDATSVALLRVDDRPVAAQVLMYCGKTAYTWKTAFDAAYARYSPGALLVDKVSEQLLDGGICTAIDSCSGEDGFMAGLWTGRRRMADLVIDVGAGWSPRFALEAAWQYGFYRLRDARNWLRKRTSR
jgi:CelD/BcsL family acetyltransferase involved in cellulose biosynthesis